jgi:hypothetical protein
MHPGQATGPRTPEGKAISALNGTTHGFCAVRISEKNVKGKKIEKVHQEKLTEAYKPRRYAKDADYAYHRASTNNPIRWNCINHRRKRLPSWNWPAARTASNRYTDRTPS